MCPNSTRLRSKRTPCSTRARKKVCITAARFFKTMRTTMKAITTARASRAGASLRAALAAAPVSEKASTDPSRSKPASLSNAEPAGGRTSSERMAPIDRPVRSPSLPLSTSSNTGRIIPMDAPLERAYTTAHSMATTTVPE
ncbi:MAG: hypothetical protein BWX47_02113 [candidate division Hyd24-12 bacterium ADurb.Bin004]|nr:MAG: hypothetical protein BWX47_02113 [candidate division Hyd24-12 bacterium ADurb.Bin004]